MAFKLRSMTMHGARIEAIALVAQNPFEVGDGGVELRVGEIRRDDEPSPV